MNHIQSAIFQYNQGDMAHVIENVYQNVIRTLGPGGELRAANILLSIAEQVQAKVRKYNED